MRHVSRYEVGFIEKVGVGDDRLTDRASGVVDAMASVGVRSVLLFSKAAKITTTAGAPAATPSARAVAYRGVPAVDVFRRVVSCICYAGV